MNNNFGDFLNFMNRKSPKEYYIVENLENITEKDCAKYDVENERLYQKLVNKATREKRRVSRGGFNVDIDVPLPPKPNNRERYILWKKRNMYMPVISQSESVLFLNKRGYRLGIDYEAFQAINLANEIKHMEGIYFETRDLTQNFENVYNNKDKNIFRQRSMYGKEIVDRSIMNNIRNYHDTNKSYDNRRYSMPTAPLAPNDEKQLKKNELSHINELNKIQNSYNDKNISHQEPPKYDNYKYNRNYNFYKSEESLYPKIDDDDVY